MTGYLTKLKAEMEGRLGSGIEVVEDRDVTYCNKCHGVFASNLQFFLAEELLTRLEAASPWKGAPGG